MLQYSMKHVIEVIDLVKTYNKAKENAVDGISFHVNDGEFFSLLGPNGAGKTTTISILTTTLSKTSGTIKVDGRDIDTYSKQIRNEIGVIFQNPSLDKNLTAEENIRFHVTLYGLYPFRPAFTLMPTSYKKKVQELADVLDLGRDLFKPIKSYSGGMKRKLEIVRSLMHNPKILYLDEPTTGLDPLSRRNLWEYLKEVRAKQKTTIFLTTHYLEEAEGADHICVINHGKIAAYGEPEEVKRSLIEEYIIVDAKNRHELEAEIKSKNLPFEVEKHIKVDVKGLNPAELVQQLKTPLTFLQVHAPTLEEAYLELIEKSIKSESL